MNVQGVPKKRTFRTETASSAALAPVREAAHLLGWRWAASLTGARAALHYRLRWPFGDSEMQKKKCKSNSLFLIHFWYHTPKKCLFGAAMTQILHRKKIRKILEDKICQQFKKKSQKGRRGPQRKLKFWLVKKGIMSSKKVQNSNFHWGPLQGENGLLK